MQLTVTVDDAVAAVVQPHVGELSTYVQRQVEGWLTQIATTLASQEGDTLRNLWGRLPPDGRAQIQELVAPYREPARAEQTTTDRTPEEG